MTPDPFPSEPTPRHADVWRRSNTESRFTVMTVCAHHDPPHVTGYWNDESGPTCQHGSYPLPRFLAAFTLETREFPDA